MLSSPLPSLKEIVGLPSVNNSGYWDKDDCILTSGTAASVKLIIEAVKYIRKKNEIKIMLPALFCQDTINYFNIDGVHISFYPLDEKLRPDIKKIRESYKQEYDIMLSTHYFGKLYDFNDIKVFCKQHSIIFLEDCAHAVMRRGKMSYYGDIALYSPHKVLPLPDGGVICFNRKGRAEVADIYSCIKSKVDNKRHGIFDCWKWRIKKLVQKIVKKEKNIDMKLKVHYGIPRKENGNKYIISAYAKKILTSYDEKKLNAIVFKRKKNLSVINSLIKRQFPEAIPMVDDNTEQPYIAVYNLKNVNDKNDFLRKLKQRNIPMAYWPDLPPEIAAPEFQNIMHLSSEIVTIPIIQDIDIKEYVEKLSVKVVEKEVQSLSICFSEDKDAYTRIYKKIKWASIPQDWDYGTIRATRLGCQAKRALIKNDVNEIIGIVQILEQCIVGKVVAVRINRGPLFLEEYDKIAYHKNVMQLLHEYYGKYVCLFYAPQIMDNIDCLLELINGSWKIRDIQGYSSGVLDLTVNDECSLRKRINSKWRNQLKSSEINNLDIKRDFSRFYEIMHIYEKAQASKHFKGISRDILLKMHGISKLELLYIENSDNDIIAFDIFYVTESFAVYLVGWNSAEGRKYYANNLLLYSEAKHLMCKGVRWYDLGGIDLINTPENAKFKMGMNPQYYELLGEFTRWG